MSVEESADRYLEDWLRVSPVVLYALRLSGGEPGSFWVSGTVERVTGYSREDALSPGWWEANLHPDDRDRVLGGFANILRDGHLVHEYRFRHAGGNWLWIRDELRVSDRRDDEVVGTWSDVTPLKRAQRIAEEAVLESIQRLEDSDQRYRALLENNPNPVYWLDGEGRFTAVNTATEAISGRSEEELIGMTFREVVHPDDLDRVQAAFEAAWGGSSQEYELRVVRPDGALRHIRGVSAPMRVEGETVGVYGVATDETDRLQEASQRQHLEEQLHQAQKMEAVGRLAGGVAHDFNNLLTGLRGLVGLRLDEMSEADPARADFEEVDKIAERASALVRQLLAFSRNQVLHSRVLDLNTLVRETDRMLRRILGEDVQLTTELDPGESPVKADPAQLQQVIMNLVVNARHAMPEGGRLWLRTRNDQDALGDDDGPRDVVVLEVEDTGEGIPPEIIERIFDPFFTTKGAGEGTGLGLSTVYGVVRQSGGDVTVDSEPGRGTTFRVILPRVSMAIERPVEVADAPQDGTSTGTVLVVEDERTVRQLITRILMRKGYAVVEAVSAEEALEWLEGSRSVDLLISDVIMPGMSGPELVARVREHRPDTPVLMISGYDEDRLVSMPEGRTAFLAKPFTPAELISRISRLL